VSGRLHPLFRSILAGIELQPVVLHRAAVKAEQRRFTGEPVTAFAALSLERQTEIRADELADQRADQHRERLEQGL